MPTRLLRTLYLLIQFFFHFFHERHLWWDLVLAVDLAFDIFAILGIVGDNIFYGSILQHHLLMVASALFWVTCLNICTHNHINFYLLSICDWKLHEMKTALQKINVLCILYRLPLIRIHDCSLSLWMKGFYISMCFFPNFMRLALLKERWEVRLFVWNKVHAEIHWCYLNIIAIQLKADLSEIQYYRLHLFAWIME